MRKILKVIVAACCLAGSVGAAQAEPVATVWSDSARIVGRAATGPALWKLQRGDSTVWVLAALPVVPQDLARDTFRFEQVLTGAKVLILPAEMKPWAPHDIDLPAGVTLKDVVSPATWQRFVATAAGENASLDNLATLKPAWAAPFLMGAAAQRRGLREESYPPAIDFLAIRTGTPVRRPETSFDFSLLMNARNRLTPAEAETCMLAYLDYIDTTVPQIGDIGKAWANSDVATVLSEFKSWPMRMCLPAGDTTIADGQNAAADSMADTIDAALKTPGKSVAVVPLEDFLAKGGILDRLLARGAALTPAVE